MSNTIMLIFAGVETLVVTATAILAWINIKKFRDSRGVDFVINAESKIDPLYQSLIDATPEHIRSIYRGVHDLRHLTDDEVRVFPFMQSLYHHVSRIVFMVADQGVDIGLRRDARREVMAAWVASLANYKHHPAMKVVHTSAMRHQDFNDSFLAVASSVMLTTEGSDSRERKAGASESSN